MQSANLLQKAMLDVLTAKVVRVKQILLQPSTEHFYAGSEEATYLRDQQRRALWVISLDRHEIQTMQPATEFDNPEIQAILTRAVDEMTAVLLRGSE